MITLSQIQENMTKHGLKATDLVEALGINKSTVSLWLSGDRAMTKAVEAMFYYYFKTLDMTLAEQLNGRMDRKGQESPVTVVSADEIATVDHTGRKLSVNKKSNRK